VATAAWESVITDLVAERGEALLRYATLISGRPDDAADLVQDALVKTFGRLRNGLSLQSAEAYVRRAILNAHLDGGRRVTRWRRISHLAAVPEVQDSPAPASDERLDVLGELRRLAPRERACLVLRYYEDLKVDDIASALGISSGAVKRYLSDGLARMSVALRADAADSAETPPQQVPTPSRTAGGPHAR
jgi:RNA polymerase sigma factor (sigma-70 family)